MAVRTGRSSWLLVLLCASGVLLLHCSLGSGTEEPQVVLDKYRKILLVGETEIINASISTNEPLAWSSSDESVVVVAGTGEVTGVAAGTAIVTVGSDDGSTQARSYVTVLSEIPKNVILCIGDGMGHEQVRAAGMFQNGSEGTLSFETLPYQNDMTTHSASSSITDSAAAGTAMATGRKVNNGVLSMAIPGDGGELQSLVEFMKDKGKRTGLVTTTHMTNATPAAFGAHESSRSNYAAIALDYVTGSKPNVLFGGGGLGMTTAITEAAGYQTVEDTEGFDALDPAVHTYYSAQFGAGNLPYMGEFPVPGTYPYPELSELTEKALAILAQDPDGFFLMVEGGRIDHACHVNDIDNAVYEAIEFADAVERVVDWMAGNEAVLVVTADHETGGLHILQNNAAGIMPTVEWTTDYHTGVEVPIYLSGCDQDFVFGEFDNTHIFQAICDLYE